MRKVVRTYCGKRKEMGKTVNSGLFKGKYSLI